jgi:hypothetical protein
MKNGERQPRSLLAQEEQNRCGRRFFRVPNKCGEVVRVEIDYYPGREISYAAA